MMLMQYSFSRDALHAGALGAACAGGKPSWRRAQKFYCKPHIQRRLASVVCKAAKGEAFSPTNRRTMTWTITPA